MAKSAEAVILLDLVKVIQIKSRHIEIGFILLTIDCRELFKIIDREMITPNQHVQDIAAKAAMINQVRAEIKFNL